MGKSKAAIAADQPHRISPELHRLLEPIDKVRPLEGNARRGDVEAIKESIAANGLYRAPIARRETGEILINNHTTLACRELGFTHIPIDWRSVPDDADAEAIALADNRTSDLASWDKEALAASLERAKAGGRLAATGFDPDAFAAAIGAAAATAGPDPDPQPPPAKPKSRTGRTYELGPHLLLCGDATGHDAWSELEQAAGAPIDMVWTDPPYGVDLGPLAASRGRDHGDMAGDADAAAAADLLQTALEHAHLVTRPGGALYVAHADALAQLTHAAIRDAGWTLRQQLIWRKNHLVLGRQDYQWRHEAIAYGWKPGAAHRWYGGFDKTTVIENPSRAALEALDREDLVEIAHRLLEGEPGTIIDADKPAVAEHHPTAKPASLIEKHLRNSCPDGGTVADPFAGSGSTMVAAHNTGRRALMVELEPAYCDVIRNRWKDLESGSEQAA